LDHQSLLLVVAGVLLVRHHHLEILELLVVLVEVVLVILLLVDLRLDLHFQELLERLLLLDGVILAVQQLDLKEQVEVVEQVVWDKMILEMEKVVLVFNFQQHLEIPHL
jgi:hypothetical protein